MPVDVSQALLHTRKDAVSRSRDSRPKFSGIRSSTSILLRSEKTSYVPRERRGKSRFVQQWRMQQVRNRPDIAAHVVDQRGAVRNCRSGLGQTLDIRSHRGEIHGQCSQRLPDAVVEFSRNPPPLFVCKWSKRAESSPRL